MEQATDGTKAASGSFSPQVAIVALTSSDLKRVLDLSLEVALQLPREWYYQPSSVREAA